MRFHRSAWRVHMLFLPATPSLVSSTRSLFRNGSARLRIGLYGAPLRTLSTPQFSPRARKEADENQGDSLPHSRLDRLPAPPKIPMRSRNERKATVDHHTVMNDMMHNNIKLERRIFCNRNVNMSTVTAVGFDQDYTLAQYRPEEFETLVHTLTVDKLVQVFGYPEMLYSLDFDWTYMIRGLTIDKQRGNILKIDRHKYVKVAYHGFKPLSRSARLNTYTRISVRDALDEPEKYTLIDTLFSLAEAYLYMQLVELKDEQPELLPGEKSYADLYRDVRGAVDLCHRDGTLKRVVAADPERYIHKDPALVPLLTNLRRSGRKVFLATNSLWDYTNVVMNFLLADRVGAAKDDAWLAYFDVVVTGCGKPSFFKEQKPLFEVHVQSGMLYNTDDGSPMIPVGQDDLPELVVAIRNEQLEVPGLSNRGISSLDNPATAPKSRVYQGGNYTDLHKMLAVASGSEVLYVGDHIYGDILRSKKSLGWRTMLVLPELESELRILQNEGATLQELKTLRLQRAVMEDQIERMEWQLQRGLADGRKLGDGGDWVPDFRRAIENLKEHRDRVHKLHSDGLRAHHERHHPIWGQLLKTSYQNSQFAQQVDNYACLYTSHVANLLMYSPEKRFRGKLDSMQHEEELAMYDLTTSFEGFAYTPPDHFEVE